MTNRALLQFIKAKGAGDSTIRRLADLAALGGVSPADVVAMQPQKIAAVLDTRKEVAESILAAKEPAARLGDELDAQGVQLLWLNDSQYPERLRAVLGMDAPPVLFVKGNQDLLAQPAVSFCGSRKASRDGLEVTERAARILANEGVCVVSGYAHGVDMAAHRGVLAAGGTTILVLAEGILCFQVKKDIEDLLAEGNHLIVSQFPPRLPWIGRNAMKRNGTIIGLSDAMILVESGRDGGTFAAGSEALKRHHPLFVVDFAHPGPSAEANPHFLERGGIPLRGDRERVPNLQKVLEVTRHPNWRVRRTNGLLFS